MTSFMESIRKSLDRAGFEADKLMRANRVRAEGMRLSGQAREQTLALGERALALYTAGNLHDPDLVDLARRIVEAQERGRQKEEEANTIQAEPWVEPPDGSGGAGPSVSQSPVAGVPVAPYTPSYPAPPPTSTYPHTGPVPPPYVSPAPYVPPPAPAAPPPSPAPYSPPATLDAPATRRVPAPNQQAYCDNCGAPLRPQAAFCAQCGRRV